jgi:hypothetical protein
MARTEIELEPEVQRRAVARAQSLGLSLSAYVRELVTRDLGSRDAPLDVSAMFDLGASGGSDIATFKDAYISDAFAADRKRSPTE